MGVKQVVCGVSVVLMLGGAGSALAQRHPPAAGGHAMAVPRHGRVQRRAARPGRIVVRPHGYVYGRHHEPAMHFGLYLGGPYSYPAYSYSYPYYYYYRYPHSYVYAYPYSYPYVDPYSYSYSYPYPYSYSSPYSYSYPYPSYTNPDGGSMEVMPSPAPPPGQESAPAAQPTPVERGTLAVEGAPDKATIFVDGNYAGYASDFAAPHPLSEPAGYHRIEIKAPGRRPVVVHVDIQPGRTLTYQYPTDNPRQ